jgi:hypothetical protein
MNWRTDMARRLGDAVAARCATGCMRSAPTWEGPLALSRPRLRSLP